MAIRSKRPGVALDHVSLAVRRPAAARKFYEAALGAIGMTVNMEVGSSFGMGANGEKIFWIERDLEASGGEHYAFRVRRRADVDAFHSAAMRAGGLDNGPPGDRPAYGPSYYAAFVKDSEGNNIEVVCYTAPRKPRPTRRARA